MALAGQVWDHLLQVGQVDAVHPPGPSWQSVQVDRWSRKFGLERLKVELTSGKLSGALHEGRLYR